MLAYDLSRSWLQHVNGSSYPKIDSVVLTGSVSSSHFCGECGGLLGRGTTNASDDQVKIWEAVRKHFADGCRLTDYYD